MRKKLWSVEIESVDTSSTTYSVLAPTIEIAMAKARAKDKKEWEGDDRAKRREIVHVSLDDRKPIV